MCKQYSTGILSYNYNAPYMGHMTNSRLPDSLSDASHVFPPIPSSSILKSMVKKDKKGKVKDEAL